MDSTACLTLPEPATHRKIARSEALSSLQWNSRRRTRLSPARPDAGFRYDEEIQARDSSRSFYWDAPEFVVLRAGGGSADLALRSAENRRSFHERLTQWIDVQALTAIQPDLHTAPRLEIRREQRVGTGDRTR